MIFMIMEDSSVSFASRSLTAYSRLQAVEDPGWTDGLPTLHPEVNTVPTLHVACFQFSVRRLTLTGSAVPLLAIGPGGAPCVRWPHSFQWKPSGVVRLTGWAEKLLSTLRTDKQA